MNGKILLKIEQDQLNHVSSVILEFVNEMKNETKVTVTISTKGGK